MALGSGARGSQERAFNVALGERIRERRLSQGMSLTALGRAVGVAYQQIQKYETGVDRIAASRLVAIAAALDVTAAALLGEDADAAEAVVARDRETQRLLTKFRQCSPANQALILKMASSLAPSTPRGEG